jgi:hypothetical protein
MQTVPLSFRVIPVLALLWNLLGLFSFYYHVTATPETIATWPEAQQRLFELMPRWIFVPFAVATIGGVLGSLGLVLRRRWATPALLLSLLGIVIQFGAQYATTPTWAGSGARGLILPLVLAAIGLFLWRYARGAAARGWLR